MKLIFTSLLFLISLKAISQNGRISGHISKGNDYIIYFQLLILLKRDDSIILKTIPDSNFNFKIRNLQEGKYSLSIQVNLLRDTVTESITVFKDSVTNINIAYPGPCKYIYSGRKKIRCVDGHTDHIIPIRYGFPSQKTMAKAKTGLIHLGGCIITECDPHYYCTIHKREL